MLIKPQHLAELFSRAAADQEVCGILIGRRTPRLCLESIVPARNVHSTPQGHYLLDAPTLLHADTAARAAGLEIIGFYHSHPNGSAVASMLDRRDAWPGYVYLIVAVARAAPRYLCGWIIGADGSLRPELIIN